MTRSLRTARMLVAGSALCAPVAGALLLKADGHPAWPTLVALAVGVVARAAAPASTIPLLAGLALAPLWQAAASVVAGSSNAPLLMPWLAALAGWLAWPVGAPWGCRGNWQLAVAAWSVTIAMAWPATVWRELDFTLQTIGVATPNGTSGMTPHQAGAFVALSAEAQIVALLLFDWAWGAEPVLRRRAWLALAPGVALACAVALWQQAVDPSFLSRAPWIGLDRAAGPFFDANAMGALAALVAAALAGPGMSPARVPGALWSATWAATALAGVLASGSRTALAALVGSAAAASIATLRGWRRMMGGAAVAMLVVLALRLAAEPPDAGTGNAAGRLASTIRRLVDSGATGAWNVAWDRDGYGPAAMAVIAEHPWVGLGPGMFGMVVADYAQMALGRPLPPDNAQNWWRQQLAELGVLGGVGALWGSLLAFGAVLRSWRPSAPQGSPARTAPLVALGLMAFVSPPTQHPIVQVLVGLLVAQAVVPPGKPREDAARALPSKTFALAWALALTSAAGLAIGGWIGFRPPQRAARFHFDYSYGLSAPVSTPFGDGRWSARRSVAVGLPGNRLLDAFVVLPHDDLRNSPVEVTVSDGSGVVCREIVRDRTPLRCRLRIPDGQWFFAQVDVSRGWRTESGVEQAALVWGRFERLEP